MKKKIHYFCRMWGHAIEYRKEMRVIMVGQVVLGVLIPFGQLLLSAQVIEWLIAGITIDAYLIQLAYWVVGLLLLKLLEFYLERRKDTLSENFRLKYWTLVQVKLVSLDYPLTLGQSGQDKYAKVMELIGDPTVLFGRWLSDNILFWQSLIAVVVYVGVLMQLELLFIVGVIAVTIGLVVFKYYQHRLQLKLSTSLAQNEKKNKYLRATMSDSRIAKDVRLYEMKHWFNRVQHQIVKEYYRITQPKIQLIRMEHTFLATMIMLLTWIAYSRSVYLIAINQLGVSQFVIYVGTITLVSGVLTQLVNSASKINLDISEYQYYIDFMEQEEVFNHQKGVELPKGDITIELRNVSYTYPNATHASLKRINLILKPNERVAIVGENGAGKTTLVNLIGGLIQPTEGEILINGVPQKEFNILDYYELFSTVFQHSHLLTYTVKETVLQGYEYDKERYLDVLSKSGVAGFVNDLPNGDETHIVRSVHQDAVQLSGGQLQKVKLAQALYKDAPVMILDEPTAALDPLAEHEIYQQYLRFAQNKLSLFISHRLASTRFCDRILYLKQGEITEEGSHESLLEQKKDYYHLYETQAYYYKNNLEEQPEIVEGGII